LNISKKTKTKRIVIRKLGYKYNSIDIKAYLKSGSEKYKQDVIDSLLRTAQSGEEKIE
jgi:hypothetical protein